VVVCHEELTVSNAAAPKHRKARVTTSWARHQRSRQCAAGLRRRSCTRTRGTGRRWTAWSPPHSGRAQAAFAVALHGQAHPARAGPSGYLILRSAQTLLGEHLPGSLDYRGTVVGSVGSKSHGTAGTPRHRPPSGTTPSQRTPPFWPASTASPPTNGRLSAWTWAR